MYKINGGAHTNEIVNNVTIGMASKTLEPLHSKGTSEGLLKKYWNYSTCCGWEDNNFYSPLEVTRNVLLMTN